MKRRDPFVRFPLENNPRDARKTKTDLRYPIENPWV